MKLDIKLGQLYQDRYRNEVFIIIGEHSFWPWIYEVIYLYSIRRSNYVGAVHLNYIRDHCNPVYYD